MCQPSAFCLHMYFYICIFLKTEGYKCEPCLILLLPWHAIADTNIQNVHKDEVIRLLQAFPRDLFSWHSFYTLPQARRVAGQGPQFIFQTFKTFHFQSIHVFTLLKYTSGRGSYIEFKCVQKSIEVYYQLLTLHLKWKGLIPLLRQNNMLKQHYIQLHNPHRYISAYHLISCSTVCLQLSLTGRLMQTIHHNATGVSQYFWQGRV